MCFIYLILFLNTTITTDGADWYGEVPFYCTFTGSEWSLLPLPLFNYVLTDFATFSFQKQFMYTKGRPQTSRNEDASSQGSALVDEEVEAHDDPEHLVDAEEAPPSVDKAEPHKPVADRIRVPVAYDDLFEDGEIHEEPPQN